MTGRDFERPVLIRLFWAFVIATALFIGIFLFAYSVSYLNYQYIASQNNLIEQSIIEIESYIAQDCNASLVLEASEKLDVVGVRLDMLEKKFGKTDYRVMEQKKLYSELEKRHFDIIQKYNENCGANYSTVFFFYSNDGYYEDANDRVSYILRSLKGLYPDQIMVYSFDYDLDYALINEMKEKYGVDSVPSVVLDEGKPFYLENIKQIESEIIK